MLDLQYKLLVGGVSFLLADSGCRIILFDHIFPTRDSHQEIGPVIISLYYGGIVAIEFKMFLNGRNTRGTAFGKSELL